MGQSAEISALEPGQTGRNGLSRHRASVKLLPPRIPALWDDPPSLVRGDLEALFRT
jgi:hypothetical protein